MARLNISIPPNLAPLVAKWRRKINLSEICASALLSELAAAESHRSALPLLRQLRRPSAIEQGLARRFGLREACVMAEPAADEREIREGLGAIAADYLNRNLSDGSVLAIGGGRQTWCVVEHMSPRQIAIDLVALGYRQNDPQLLNAHPNILVTILWLLFSPRARAWLVGSNPREPFGTAVADSSRPRYFVVGSCAPFGMGSGLIRLMGKAAAGAMLSRRVAGDFLYNFFDRGGGVVQPQFWGEHSLFSADELRALSGRPGARVVLVAGGMEKAAIIRRTLEARLCNVLITEPIAAKWLLTSFRRPAAEPH